MKKFLLPTYEYPPVRGGVSEYLFGMVSALPEGSVAVLKLNDLRQPLRWMSDVFRVRRMVRELGSEALIISHVLPLGYIALAARLFMRLPYIVIVHGTDLKMAGRSPWKKAWAGIILRHASQVVANSAYTKGLAATFGVAEEKLSIVYPSPAAGSIISAPRPHAQLTLLAVARLVKRKGIDRLLRILPKLAETFPDVETLIGGGGPEETRLKALAEELGLGKRVRFLGTLDRAALEEAYDSADIFVLPGTARPEDVEGFGIVFLEAGLHALPVVAGRIGGVSEAVDDGVTGILTDASSDDELLAAVQRLLSEPETRRRMGEAGRARVLREFTWDRQAAGLAERLERA